MSHYVNLDPAVRAHDSDTIKTFDIEVATSKLDARTRVAVFDVVSGARLITMNIEAKDLDQLIENLLAAKRYNAAHHPTTTKEANNVQTDPSNRRSVGRSAVPSGNANAITNARIDRATGEHYIDTGVEGFRQDPDYDDQNGSADYH